MRNCYCSNNGSVRLRAAFKFSCISTSPFADLLSVRMIRTLMEMLKTSGVKDLVFIQHLEFVWIHLDHCANKFYNGTYEQVRHLKTTCDGFHDGRRHRRFFDTTIEHILSCDTLVRFGQNSLHAENRIIFKNIVYLNRSFLEWIWTRIFCVPDKRSIHLKRIYWLNFVLRYLLDTCMNKRLVWNFRESPMYGMTRF